MRKVGLCCSFLKQGLGFDLQKFQLDRVAVVIGGSQPSQDGTSLVFAAVVDEPSGGKRHKKHPGK